MPPDLELDSEDLSSVLLLAKANHATYAQQIEDLRSVLTRLEEAAMEPDGELESAPAPLPSPSHLVSVPASQIPTSSSSLLYG